MTDYIIVCIEKPMENTDTQLLELVNKFIKTLRYKINILKKLYFCTLAMNTPKIKVRK